jgi:ESCRT-I complex subunit VPS28
VCPVLQDLVQAMAACDFLPPDFAGKERPKVWYLQLYNKPASYELTPEETRQISFDLEASYTAFKDFIK